MTAEAGDVGREGRAPAESAGLNPGFVRACKFMAAVALIPVCAAAAGALYDLSWGPWNAAKWALFGPGDSLKLFAAGAGVFAAVAILFWRPMVVYAFAHELTHAIATWLCLGSVTNLRASAGGGSVTTSKSNTFIRLAPYMIPMYALILAASFFALDRLWRPLDAWRWLLSFGLGFTYAFHLGYTLYSLHREQPDLKPDGWLFSMVLVFLANMELLVVVVALATQPGAVGTVMAQYNAMILDRAGAHYNEIADAVRHCVGAVWVCR